MNTIYERNLKWILLNSFQVLAIWICFDFLKLLCKGLAGLFKTWKRKCVCSKFSRFLLAVTSYRLMQIGLFHWCLKKWYDVFIFISQSVRLCSPFDSISISVTNFFDHSQITLNMVY